VTRQIRTRLVILLCALAVTALTSESADWEPITLVLALGGVMTVADAPVVFTRRLRMSGGLMVQATAMALLGPAPAVAIGLASTGIESRLNRVSAARTCSNAIIVTVLGLVGGVLFEALGARFGLDRNDGAYGLLVLPVYALLLALNLLLIAGLHPDLAPSERRRVFVETGLPALPFELVSGLVATAVVLAWPQVGFVAIAGLFVALFLTVPLARTLGEAMRSDDRASEVARLSSDRERLMSEMLLAESRERARLAELLHDGPMQRLTAMRQDAAERRDDTAALDQTIAETRAIISAFHPATVREQSFETSLRAAVAPFPAARSITLTVTATAADETVLASTLLPVAQELVVNAVKHASPTAIDVAVTDADGRLTLEVNDDGVGIDTGRANRAVQAGHLGLAMVRRRVEAVGGTLEITTRPDGGTRSRVIL
jgi:signal transduction histidine kinase